MNSCNNNDFFLSFFFHFCLISVFTSDLGPLLLLFFTPSFLPFSPYCPKYFFFTFSSTVCRLISYAPFCFRSSVISVSPLHLFASFFPANILHKCQFLKQTVCACVCECVKGRWRRNKRNLYPIAVNVVTLAISD